MVNHLKNIELEFETVDLLLKSKTQTGRTDAFILSWVKVEKQIRRLFTYIVFQFPAFSQKDVIIKVLVLYRNLYIDNFVMGFNALYPVSFQQIIGSTYSSLWSQLMTIRRNYRNKILHGQLTGHRLDAKQLADQVEIMRSWTTLVAEKLGNEIGYDGIEPKAFRKSNTNISSRFKLQIKNTQELTSFIEHSMGGRI